MQLTRRDLLKTTASGFGYLAFAALANQAAAREAQSPLGVKSPHFLPRAKRVIFLSMAGGPSHVDTFDYKPKLKADDGKSFTGGRVAFGGKLMASPWKFKQHGQSGLWI